MLNRNMLVLLKKIVISYSKAFKYPGHTYKKAFLDENPITRFSEMKKIKEKATQSIKMSKKNISE